MKKISKEDLGMTLWSLLITFGAVGLLKIFIAKIVSETGLAKTLDEAVRLNCTAIFVLSILAAFISIFFLREEKLALVVYLF